MLKLELETLDYKVNQLMPILERLKSLRSKEFETHIVDGQPARTKFILRGEPAVFNWSGPANIDGQSFPPYTGKVKLNYHVVTLTWRLHFPGIPRAHIPSLRRAPRIGVPMGPLDALYKIANADNSFAYQPRSRYYHNIEQERRAQRLLHGARSRARNRNEPEPSCETQILLGGMLGDEMQLHNEMEWYAGFHERLRRLRFNQAMSEIRAVKWTRRWEAEQSLLKFEDYEGF